jgi:hypothetical protein
MLLSYLEEDLAGVVAVSSTGLARVTTMGRFLAVT